MLAGNDMRNGHHFFKARPGLQANEERNKWMSGFFIRSDNVFALFRCHHFEGEANSVSFERFSVKAKIKFPGRKLRQQEFPAGGATL